MSDDEITIRLNDEDGRYELLVGDELAAFTGEKV